MKDLTLLGKSGATEPTALLESFPRPAHVNHVTMMSDEVTALCPVTGAPDWYTVEVDYFPKDRCIESKSLKLKIQNYRNTGVFCERLASALAEHVMDSISPHYVTVTVIQKPRGGVSIVAKAHIKEGQYIKDEG